MRILVTNDDGVGAAGLAILARWASRWGEVTIAAPKTEQSGKSHSIELHKSFEALRLPDEGPIVRYSIDSTPADCVRFAFDRLGGDFDFVLSGINNGFNVGADIVYSGTDGAVFEAATFGRPAAAVSTDEGLLEEAGRHLDKVFGFVRDNGLFRLHSLYNINIPADPRGVVVTRQAGPYYRDRFVPSGEACHYKAEGFSVYGGTSDLELDLDAVMNGLVSITPLTLDRTQRGVWEELRRRGL